MGIFLSIVPLILPFINLFYIARQLERFYSNKKHMKIFEDYCNTALNNNLQWRKLTAKEIMKGLEDKHYSKFASRYKKSFIECYKKAYHSLVMYCAAIVLSAVVWVMALIFNIWHYQTAHLELTSVLLLYGFGTTWLLGVAPLLDFLRLWGRIPEKINDFVYNVIGPYGKLAMVMPKIAIRLAILPINAFVFAIYLIVTSNFLKNHLPVDLFMFIILFGIYQYIICPLYAFITFYIFKNKQEMKGKTVQSFEYYHAIIRNNTYFLFLIIYIFVKYIQLFGIEKYGMSMVEAIGILFLLDTYLQQNKFIDGLEKGREKSSLPNEVQNSDSTVLLEKNETGKSKGNTGNGQED